MFLVVVVVVRFGLWEGEAEGDLEEQKKANILLVYLCLLAFKLVDLAEAAALSEAALRML